MRPSDTEKGTSIYECFECGRRLSEGESRECPHCGGDLRHLGRPRDL